MIIQVGFELHWKDSNKTWE